MFGILHQRAAVVISTLVFGSAALGGPEWVEQGDAGPLPGSAQSANGSGQLTKIRGTLTGSLVGGDFQDMYEIYISDPLKFSASTFLNGGSTQFDSLLTLYSIDGYGLLANDDTPIGIAGGSPGGSTLGPYATDGTKQAIPGPGHYLLAISLFYYLPQSDAGLIFHFDNPFEISGPDGPGGGLPIIGWQNNGIASAGVGEYSISLAGVELVPAPGGMACLIAAAMGMTTRRRR